MKLALFVVLLTLSGCMIPYPHTTMRSEEITGTVIDSRTGAPVEGAKVVQRAFNGAREGKIRARTTDSLGHFRLRATHNFHLATVGPEGADWPRGYYYELVTVACPDYLPHEIRGYGGGNFEILLQPVHSPEPKR